MNIIRQWCDNPACSHYNHIGADNIRVYSHVERRFYCFTCQKSFSFDKGTFFETLRTDRNKILDAIAMLVERNSLRAISRIKGCKLDSVRHWLDLAGQHAATVSNLLIRDLHLSQVQIDELYTFVKKRNLAHAV